MATNQPEETLTYEDFLSWTVTSLKDYLSIRGLSVVGKKDVLIARAFGAYELGAPKKFTQEQIVEHVKKEYEKRLSTCGIQTDPNTLPDEAWVDNVQAWPEVDDGKIFSYILRVKAVDVDYIGKYKDQKAYSYWMSGFVDTVYVANDPLDKTLTFLKCKVCPSQKVRDDPHYVWVCVKGKESCSVVTSWCTCIAGTAEVCNHVIALLYKVNYAYNQKYISPACTSVPQGWNQGTRKEVEPGKLQDLAFRKDKKSRKESVRISDPTFRKQFDPRKPEDRVITDEKVSRLLNGIKEAIPTACVLLSIEHGTDDGLPASLPEKGLQFMQSDKAKDKPIEEVVPLFIEYCQMTKQQVMRIESATRGQHSNPAWFDQRTGRVTASNFHSVATLMKTITKGTKRRKKTKYSSLVSKILFKPESISHLPAIAWGILHEKDGVKSFMSDVASQHEGGMQGFKQSGLFVRPDYPYLAASPDGLFTCKCCPPATVEVKCPYSVRSGNIHDADVNKHVEFLEVVDGKLRLKKTHKYYTQVQAQMWVCNFSHCYFVVWTEGHKAFIENIQFDKTFCDSIVNSLTLFYKTYVIPAVLGFRSLTQCPKCDKVILEENEIESPSEASVLCIVCGCKWHLACAELTIPLDSWSCVSCLIDAGKCGGISSEDMDDDFPKDDAIDESMTDEPKTDEPMIDKPSTSRRNTCFVCSLESIPVFGEHICTVCENAVHAWCSNHEHITSSSNLVCNHCANITDT